MNDFKKLILILKNQVKFIQRIEIPKNKILLEQDKNDFIFETNQLIKKITKDNFKEYFHFIGIIDCEIDLFMEKVKK